MSPSSTIIVYPLLVKGMWDIHKVNAFHNTIQLFYEVGEKFGFESFEKKKFNHFITWKYLKKTKETSIDISHCVNNFILAINIPKKQKKNHLD